MTRHVLATVLFGAATVALSTGCGPIQSVTLGKTGRPAHRVEPAHRPGPPPHAAAHGYRHKQRRSGGGEVELAFDAGLGVYVVVDIPDLYWWDGRYLRIDGGDWYASIDLDAPDWEPCSTRSLPPGLAKKSGRASGPPGLKRGHGPPAKGRW